MVAHFPSCHHCHPHQSNSLQHLSLPPTTLFHPFLRHFCHVFLCMLNTSANAGQTVEMSITCCLNTESAPTWQTHHSDYLRGEKRRGRVIICSSGCLVVANHLGEGGAIRCWIREINYLCLAVSSELYQVANCRKKATIERSNYFTNFILKCWYHNCFIW